MVKSIEGAYRNGKVEFVEPVGEAEGSHVIVTWIHPAEPVERNSAVTTMLDELDNYYRKRDILSTDFKCCSRDVCVHEVPVFTEARSAFVGTRYQNETAGCRLLFLGLDPGDGKEWPCTEDRTPEAIRRKIERDPPGKNQHWWGTLRFALRLLGTFDPMRPLWHELDSGDCRTWGTALLKQEERRFRDLVTPSFAHANAVRCSVNARRNAQAGEILYANCHKYLRGELEVLKPDVIVSQGDRAKSGLRNCIRDIASGSNCQGGCKPKCSDRCRIICLGNRKVLWIQTYHPSQQSGLFGKEGGTSWNCYAAAADAFMRQERPE
jgi:hypothetical protein